MASFQTHLTCGAAFGVGSIFLAAAFLSVGGEWGFLALLGCAVALDSILPDMDSDTGVPFHVTFGALALVCGGLGLAYSLKYFPGDYRWIAGLPLASMLFIWAIVGSIFKKLTRHRGILHSIPATALAGLATFSLASIFGAEEWHAFLLGLAMALGYLLHLVLDEMFAAVNFHGTPFVPNKALGSALKFKSSSFGVNALVYGLILILILDNGSALLRLFDRLSALTK